MRLLPPAGLVLAALVLAASACSSPAPAGAPDAPAPSGATVGVPDLPAPLPAFLPGGIRIATLNAEFLFDGEGNEGEATFAWKGDPEAARAHRDAVAEVVRSLDAHLVMFQEVENQAVLEMMIEESLQGMGYTAHLVEGLDSFTGQNVGLIARAPIEIEAVGRTDEMVEVGLTDRRYGVSKNMWARATVGGVPVTFIGVHFLARPDDVERSDRREAQAEVIRRLVVQEYDAGRQPIVLGDFNDFDDATLDRRGSEPITDVLARIKAAGDGPADDLVNVIADVAQAERYTSFYDRNGNGTLEPGELSAIDHVLLAPALYRAVRAVDYVHAQRPGDPSDHFPIVVTLDPAALASN